MKYFFAIMFLVSSLVFAQSDGEDAITYTPPTKEQKKHIEHAAIKKAKKIKHKKSEYKKNKRLKKGTH